jgi:predicted PurR-regulated permease PerM
VRINPLLVLVSILVGASLGNWIGGFFGGFVAALLAIPVAGAMQVIVREIWRETASPPVAAAPPEVSAARGESVPVAAEPMTD